MNVSIIIVNYNTKDLLISCLESINTYTQYLDYEIIVVDNGSKDGSKEYFTQRLDIKYMYSKENLGFGRANNIGAEQASGKYLLFLNSDVLLRNNAVKYFFDFAESSHEKLGALGCILTDIFGNNIHSYGPFITLKNEIKILFTKYLRFFKDKNITNPSSIQSPLEVDYITGADLFVPRSVYIELGGFDPLFFMYCEETDWQKRMADNGYKRLIIPGPMIVHLEGGSDTNGTKVWTASRMERNRISQVLYYKKHFKGITLLFLRCFKYLMEFPITIYLTIRYPNKKYVNLLKYF